MDASRDEIGEAYPSFRTLRNWRRPVSARRRPLKELQERVSAG
jgi:hypothetical protein